eukprot:4680650-Pleurochrysis_carterae.AAC.2
MQVREGRGGNRQASRSTSKVSIRRMMRVSGTDDRAPDGRFGLRIGLGRVGRRLSEGVGRRLGHSIFCCADARRRKHGWSQGAGGHDKLNINPQSTTHEAKTFGKPMKRRRNPMSGEHKPNGGG